MTTSDAPQKPLNYDIYQAIVTACFAFVEDRPEVQRVLKERDSLIEQIEGKVPHKVSNALSDIVMDAVVRFAHPMLQIGLKLGRNPDLLFDLPESLGLSEGEKVFRNVILDSARIQSSKSEEYAEWSKKYETLQRLIDKKCPELNNKFFEVVWEGLNQRGEEMFLLGWALRDNPSELFNLPEPEVW